ncbi:MAG: PAS domain S-box-containing protein, partial [Bacteroidia bacterium]
MQTEERSVKNLELEIVEYRKRISELEQRLNSNGVKRPLNGASTDYHHANFRKFIEYAFYPMAIIDQNNKILNVNKQFQRCFGYDTTEISQVAVEKLVPNISIDPRHNFDINFNSEIGNRILGKQNDLTAYRKDGSEFPVEVGISYISSGDKYEIVATVIDV